MRAWAKMHSKSVRQQNVRQDNTMDRAGTLPLNLYETETVLRDWSKSIGGGEGWAGAERGLVMRF